MSNNIENKKKNWVAIGCCLAAGVITGAIVAFSFQPPPPSTTICIYKPSNWKFCVLGNTCPPPPLFKKGNPGCKI